MGLAGSGVAFALGGSAKDMSLAASNAQRAVEYNQWYHPGAIAIAAESEAVVATLGTAGAEVLSAAGPAGLAVGAAYIVGSEGKALIDSGHINAYNTSMAMGDVFGGGYGLGDQLKSAGVSPMTASKPAVPTIISTPIHDQKPQVFVTPPYQGPKVQLETYPESDSRFKSPVLPGFASPAKEFKLPGYEAPTLPDMRIMYNENADGGGEKLRGVNNPGTKSAQSKGMRAHKELSEKVKRKKDISGRDWKSGPQDLRDPITKKKVIPDVQTPSGHPIELKPDTPSGRRQGAKQIKKYERATGKKGRVIYYDPSNY